MNPRKDEADLVSAVDVFAVQIYLLRTGWKEEEVIANRHVILSNNREGRKFLIFLPLDKEVPDFSSRMLEVFKTLEAFEENQRLRMIANFVNIKTLQKYNTNK